MNKPALILSAALGLNACTPPPSAPPAQAKPKVITVRVPPMEAIYRDPAKIEQLEKLNVEARDLAATMQTIPADLMRLCLEANKACIKKIGDIADAKLPDEIADLCPPIQVDPKDTCLITEMAKRGQADALIEIYQATTKCLRNIVDQCSPHAQFTSLEPAPAKNLRHSQLQ